jgi:hypothetical protein
MRVDWRNWTRQLWRKKGPVRHVASVQTTSGSWQCASGPVVQDRSEWRSQNKTANRCLTRSSLEQIYKWSEWSTADQRKKMARNPGHFKRLYKAYRSNLGGEKNREEKQDGTTTPWSALLVFTIGLTGLPQTIQQLDQVNNLTAQESFVQPACSAIYK